MSQPEPFLAGERAVLRPLLPDDAPILANWINDRAVTHYMFYGQVPWTEAQTREHFTSLVEAPGNVLCMVTAKEGDRQIGFAGLFDIHPTARKAEFRVLLGERDFWSRGYGTEVTQIFSWYAFDRLNLNRLWLGVTSENAGAIRAYEKTGFRREGVLRQDIYRNSRYYDSVRMSILRDEYYSELHDDFSGRFSYDATHAPDPEALGP